MLTRNGSNDWFFDGVKCSDIPFQGPIAGVNVGYIDGKYVINPSVADKEISRLDLEVAGHKDAVNMVEAGASEITESEMLEAIFFGHEEIKRLVAFNKKSSITFNR